MKKTLVTTFILFLITLPTVLPFFNYRFFYTQDHIFIARLHQMSEALQDGQFPVRWAPDLRYGEPIFNYYAPLPFYLGFLIHMLGFNFIWVAKILFILSSLLSALTMYIFCKKLFSQKGAMLATILYVYAPYRAVDLYVRGALSEAWAFVFFPLIFYTSLLLYEKKSLKNIVFLTLSLAGLILTHNVTTLMFLPFLFLWWTYLFLRNRSLKLIISLICGLVLSLSLSAFFLLPALLEKNFIQTKYLTVGYFNFRAHFVAYKQLFSLFWGYGSSLWGTDDGLSFQVGLAHWIVLLLSLIAIFIKRERKSLILFSFLAVSFAFSLFLQHNKSSFIWEAIPLMAFIQFPWRFLAISIFFVSLIGALLIDALKDKFKIVCFALIAAALLINIQYFKPKDYVDDSFFDKFLNKEKMHKGVDLTKDYLPIWVQNVDAPQLNYPEAEEGKIAVTGFEKKGAKAYSKITVLENSIIEVPITYFPNWQVFANNNNISLETPRERGLIRFKLPTGNYDVKFEFGDTLIRIIGNFTSLSTLLLMLLMLFKYKRRFK